MLDHIILTVSDLERSTHFYRNALAPLGMTNFLEFKGEGGHPDLRGFGEDQAFCLWIKQGTPSGQAAHFGFVAKSRTQVDAFYEAALAAGGQGNISPRVRHEYDPMYYAADVLDPDGYSVEAVIKK